MIKKDPLSSLLLSNSTIQKPETTLLKTLKEIRYFQVFTTINLSTDLHGNLRKLNIVWVFQSFEKSTSKVVNATTCRISLTYELSREN